MQQPIRAIVLVAMALPAMAHAQPRGEISGRVLAARDSTPLFGVLVTVVDHPGRVVTEPNGTFFLTGLPAVPLRLAFARVGISLDTIAVDPASGPLVVYLRTAAFELDPLIATAAPAARARFDEVVQTSTVTIDRNVVQDMPALFEADVIRTIQLLPGTVAINDYTVGYNARGGEADQNLIQLDGAPVFNPTHLGGLFSTFDAAAVDEIDYLTGGFPAHYGGRLSSVLDIGLRPGKDRVSASGQVSLVSSKLLVEGPLSRNGASFLVAARRTYADRVVDWLSDTQVPYYFTDGVGRLTIPLASGGTVSATGYVSRDILDWEFVQSEADRDGISLEVGWGNRLFAANFEHLVAGRPFSFHVSSSAFSTRIGLVPDIVRIDNSTRVVTARSSWRLTTGSTHDLRIGGGVEDYAMRYDFRSRTLNANFFETAYRPRVWSAFVDETWQPTSRLMLRPGVRVESVSGASFTSVAPRVAAKYFVTRDFALTGSAGRYYQPIHSLRDHNVPWSFVDFWIGADSVTPVARSDHLVAGFERWFGRGTSLSVEGYRKTFHDIININVADDLKVQGDEFLPVEGDAWGVDVLARKYTGRVTGWIAYSFARATRRSDGQEFPPSHDRRHTINVVAQTGGPLGSDLGIRWGYGSPLPYTEFVGQWRHRYYNPAIDAYDEFEEEPLSNPLLNTQRYPHYSRLDVSFRWTTRWLGAIVHPYLQFVNLYNRGNVFFYAFDFTGRPATRQGISQLPLLPSFGVEFEF